MSAVPEFKTSAEFEAWLGEHALLAIAYAKENDVAIRDLPVSARVFTAKQTLDKNLASIPATINSRRYMVAREVEHEYPLPAKPEK